MCARSSGLLKRFQTCSRGFRTCDGGSRGCFYEVAKFDTAEAKHHDEYNLLLFPLHARPDRHARRAPYGCSRGVSLLKGSQTNGSGSRGSDPCFRDLEKQGGSKERTDRSAPDSFSPTLICQQNYAALREASRSGRSGTIRHLTPTPNSLPRTGCVSPGGPPAFKAAPPSRDP